MIRHGCRPAGKIAAALVTAALGVTACWLLAGRKIPEKVSPRLVWWALLPLIWAFGGWRSWSGSPAAWVR